MSAWPSFARAIRAATSRSLAARSELSHAPQAAFNPIPCAIAPALSSPAPQPNVRIQLVYGRITPISCVSSSSETVEPQFGFFPPMNGPKFRPWTLMMGVFAA